MNEQELRAKAADLGRPVEDLRRRDSYGDLVPYCPIELRFALFGEEGVAEAREAVAMFAELCDTAWQGRLLPDNAVVKMVLLQAEALAKVSLARAEAELG